MQFFLQVKKVLLPHLNRLMILEESQLCFVNALRGKVAGKGQTSMFSIIQLHRSLKRVNNNIKEQHTRKQLIELLEAGLEKVLQ